MLTRPDRGFIRVERHCMACNKTYNLLVDEQNYNAWLKGMFAQDAFPYATADEREMVMTGMHGNCFDNAFPDE